MSFLEQVQSKWDRLDIDVVYLSEAERNTGRYRRLVSRLSGKILDCEEVLARTPQDMRRMQLTALKDHLLQIQKRKKLAEELVSYWENETLLEEQRVRGALQAEIDKKSK